MIHLVYSEETYIDPPFAIFDDRLEALRFTERFKETRAYITPTTTQMSWQATYLRQMNRKRW